MKRLLPLLALLLLPACESERSRPHAPVDNVVYSALGTDPFWLVTIGDDVIVLTLGHPGGRADGELQTYRWPRVLPREVDGVRIWESGDGTGTVTVEARSGPCESSDGRRFADQVRVRLSGRELGGCGGRLLTGRQG